MYNFYYDESEHSRIINLSTITGETYYDNFLVAIVGWNSDKEAEIKQKYLAFEEKYAERKKKGELKSDTFKSNQFKCGFASFNKQNIELLDELLEIIDNNIYTRPVYYESRVMKLKLDESTLKLIDTEYEIMAQNADADVIEKSKRELGQMEAILGHDDTIKSLVDDILDHYESYRENLLTGKAMIVAYSRAIAMKIYKRILEVRPGWEEKVAVVMTASNKDPEEWHSIIGNKRHKEELATKFKDNESPLKIAIVVDMWLTGFDVPSLATMYVYKPMMGYNLMQAIARVNRVFRDKEGGLVVDYVGIAGALKQAMNDYKLSFNDQSNYPDLMNKAIDLVIAIREAFSPFVNQYSGD